MSQADTEQPFLSHLFELRTRLLHALYGVVGIFLLLLPFSNKIYTALAAPLMAYLPESSSMIAIDVVSPFLTPLKLCLVLGLVIALPWVLFQVWAFVAPGLYQREKRMVMPLVASSTLLFYCGMAFAYFVILPIFFQFLSGTAPEGVAVMTDIKRYLDFVLMMFLAFGIAFEVPVATIILVMIGVTTPDALAKKRPYIFLGAFVVGMFLTPPDMISQTLLAVPMWILFEVGVFLSRIIVRRKAEAAEEAREDDEEYEEPTDEDMEAELDRIEEEDESAKAPPKNPNDYGP